jgi:hypothetical protein
VGRVGRVMERRTLRRAAEETLLLTSLEIPDPLTFEAQPRPWYRKKPVLLTIAALAIAVVVLGVLLIPRTPSTGTKDSTIVSPTISTSVKPSPASQPPPGSAQPAPSVAPAPALTSATTINAPPTVTRQPLGPTQTPEAPPQIDVTRPPISVAPQPHAPPTGADDGHKRGPRGPFGCC